MGGQKLSKHKESSQQAQQEKEKNKENRPWAHFYDTFQSADDSQLKWQVIWLSLQLMTSF